MAVAGLAQGTETDAARLAGRPALWLIAAAGVAAAAASVGIALTSDRLAARGSRAR
jgi:hypothetical protein